MNTIKSIEKMYNSGVKNVEYQKIIDVILNEKKFIKERIHQIQSSRFDQYVNQYGDQMGFEKVKDVSQKDGIMVIKSVGVLEITDTL